MFQRCGPITRRQHPAAPLLMVFRIVWRFAG
jgi:hypothetical protein